MIPFLEIKVKTSSRSSVNGKSTIINVAEIESIDPNKWDSHNQYAYDEKTAMPTELTITMNNKTTYVVEKEMVYWVLVKLQAMKIGNFDFTTIGYQKA